MRTAISRSRAVAARQREVGNIGAGNEQDQPYDRHQDLQRQWRPRSAGLGSPRATGVSSISSVPQVILLLF